MKIILSDTTLTENKLELTSTYGLLIKKDGSDMWIDVLDEDFCQPYDYQHILERNPKLSFALEVRKKVEDIMTYLQEVGVLSGHEYGEYI